MQKVGKHVAHVWQYSEGFRVTRRRAFKSDWGAIRFAERTSEENGVIEVSVTLPPPKNREFGTRLGVARDGQFTQTNKEHTMSKKTDTVDAGEDAAPTKGKAKAATRVKRERVTSLVDWPELLGMADLAIKGVDMKYRPALPDGVAFEDNFCDAYARFLSGSRRTHPGSQARPFSNDELHERRQYVRKSIALVIAGKKQQKASFDAVAKRAKKEKVAKAPTKQSLTKPTPRKPVDKKADAKKTQQKKAAAKASAAKRSVKVVKQKKRGK